MAELSGSLLCMWLTKLDYHLWQKYLPVLIFGTLFLLALVKVPEWICCRRCGRWIHIGPIFFQPAELAKLVIIIYLASWQIKKERH